MVHGHLENGSSRARGGEAGRLRGGCGRPIGSGRVWHFWHFAPLDLPAAQPDRDLSVYVVTWSPDD